MKTLSLLIFFVCAAACTTTAVTRPLMAAAKDPKSKTGVIIPTQFQTNKSSIGKSGCEVVVRPIGGATFLKEFHAKPGQNLVFVDLAPGTYSFRELRCGEASTDLTFSTFPLFTVYAGKVSVAGPITIQLDAQSGAHMKVMAISTPVFKAVEKKWDPNNKKASLVSASSGEPLTHTE